jgi:hypothetical protein
MGAADATVQDVHPVDSPLVVAQQLDDLKRRAGGPLDASRPADPVNNPWRAEALDRLRGAIKAMNAERGTTVSRFTDLTVSDYEWLKARLADLPALEPLSDAENAE